jgi:hypothetical protein
MTNHRAFALKTLAALGLGAAAVALLALGAGAAMNDITGASTVGRLPVVDQRSGETPIPAVTAARPVSTTEPETTTAAATPRLDTVPMTRPAPRPVATTTTAALPAPAPTAAPAPRPTTRPPVTTTEDHHGSGGHGTDD